MPSLILCFDQECLVLFDNLLFAFLGFLCKRKQDRLPQLSANLPGGSGSKTFVLQPLLAHDHPRGGEEHFLSYFLFLVGVCDRDDHQAGREEQEEGSSVLA